MKILNIGSLNIDRVYGVAHFVRAKETRMAESLTFFCGGKGLNQSLALARAGAQVLHAGAVGDDGDSLIAQLMEDGVDTRLIKRLDSPSGHAVIQLTPEGENCILVAGGANQAVEMAHIDEMLSVLSPGDLLLLQNETSHVGHAISAAKNRGIAVALNPSPVTPELLNYPLELLDYLILNEVEGRTLAGVESNDYEEILRALAGRFPKAGIVLTVGEEGAMYQSGGQLFRHRAYNVPVADTTAAGDTFCGYFLACIAHGLSPDEALELSSAAAAIAVSRMGASPSIPRMEEVLRFRDNVQTTTPAL